MTRNTVEVWSNGCGGEGSVNFDSMVKPELVSCCNVHDLCYCDAHSGCKPNCSTGGTMQSCDEDLKSCWLENGGGTTHANFMRDALGLVGQSFYDSSQRYFYDCVNATGPEEAAAAAGGSDASGVVLVVFTYLLLAVLSVGAVLGAVRTVRGVGGVGGVGGGQASQGLNASTRLGVCLLAPAAVALMWQSFAIDLALRLDLGVVYTIGTPLSHALAAATHTRACVCLSSQRILFLSP